MLGLDLLPFMYGGMVSYKLKENPIDDDIKKIPLLEISQFLEGLCKLYKFTLFIFGALLNFPYYMLEKLLKGFLWTHCVGFRKVPLLLWEIYVSSTDQGGLGLINIKLQGLLSTKWIVHYGGEPWRCLL